MAKKIVKAREIKYPEGFLELLDKRAGRKEGELRNIVADNGTLREADEWGMRIALGKLMKDMLETSMLPAKPMSLERFSQMMWVVTLAYILGTIRVDDTGEVEVGSVKDIGFVAELLEAEEVMFRNGRKVPAQAFVVVLQHLTCEDALKEIHQDIAGKGLMKRKEISSEHAVNLAELVMKTSENITKAKFWA